MPAHRISVAIPVRNGGEQLRSVLRSLGMQTVAHELVVCDSGSTDGSPDHARACGARVLEIPPSEFNHGATRNLLMASSSGEHVAFLTQDAEPAHERWLEQLVAGFALAGDVGLVYGPYRPRASSSPAVRIELESWFSSLAPDGRPTVERLQAGERAALPAGELIGRRGFYTDANGCLARAAWQRVPFRSVGSAEDRVLALDMLRAGYAKAFMPDAAVIHSHDYGPLEELRRCFDEWRALREVYGWREPVAPQQVAQRMRGELGRARRELRAAGVRGPRRTMAMLGVAARSTTRISGALLGSHADMLPAAARRRLSLERRGGFCELELDRAVRPGSAL